MDENRKIDVPVMADMAAKGQQAEYLFWVGCAGAFDGRYKKVARSFAKILNHLKTDYAVLGKEESCTGDPARRAGNEMLFLMQAYSNIEIFNSYNVRKIITICPHCYNTLKNEYPDVGGKYDVINYTQFLEDKIKSGELKFDIQKFKAVKVTFHDPCYLGRANNIYDSPRFVLNAAGCDLQEMERNRSFSFCCGAGGAQMFKDSEKGDKEIFAERTEEAIATNAEVVATSCPFCMTMITDGLKKSEKEDEIQNLDIVEIISQSLNL